MLGLHFCFDMFELLIDIVSVVDFLKCNNHLKDLAKWGHHIFAPFGMIACCFFGVCLVGFIFWRVEVLSDTPGVVCVL